MIDKIIGFVLIVVAVFLLAVTYHLVTGQLEYTHAICHCR